MFTPPGLGYDRAITVFSPNGRLFQVEYALEAVKGGTTAIGLQCAEGVVLAVERKIEPLQEAETVEKTFLIDQHIGTAIAGLGADAQVLVEQARVAAQVHRLTYGEEISVKKLTRELSDTMQFFTQQAGARPYGVSLLIAGIDENQPQLFLVDPSGSFWGYWGIAIGNGGDMASRYLEKEYSHSLSLEELKILAVKTLIHVSKEPLTPKLVEISQIPLDTALFTKVPQTEVSSILKTELKETR
jgi:proteasome alpha subunit